MKVPKPVATVVNHTVFQNVVAVLRVAIALGVMVAGIAIVAFPLIALLRGAQVDFSMMGTLGGIVLFLGGYIVLYPEQAGKLIASGLDYWRQRKGGDA